MLIIPPAKYQKGSRPAKRTKGAPAALTLTAAVFDGTGPGVTLTFDRAVDIADIDPSVIRVYDGDFSLRVYMGSSGGASLTGPATVQLELEEFGTIAPGPVSLVASDASGIVATDGGTWAGADEVPLPYEAP